MTFYVENETDVVFNFDIEKLIEAVALAALEAETCPYEVEVNVLLTDNEGIRMFNAEHRGMDKETDVLSFPNVEFETPSDFSHVEDEHADCFHPDSGELILGDIILSVDKIAEQAASYGHEIKREAAFLIAHSMFHLCGYDHMEETEARVMEEKQERLLKEMGITR